MDEDKFYLTEKEKAMYGISAITLVISFFVLIFAGFNVTSSIMGNVIAGYVVMEDDNETLKGNETANESAGITQEMALNALLQAETHMKELQEAGFGVIFINDTIIEAKRYFKGEDYTALIEEVEKIEDDEKRQDARNLLLAAQETTGVEVDYARVVDLSNLVAERKEKTYKLNDLIRAVELRIGDFKLQNVDATEAEEILANAINEFENERFGNVENILSNVDAKLIELSAETTIVRTLYRAGKDNLIDFVKDHYVPILLLLGSLLAIAILLYNRIMMAMLRRRIKDMKLEKDVLEELMKKAQSDYFAKGDITKQTFEIKMAKFKEKFVEIKQKLPVAETLLDKRLKSKRML